MLFNRPQGFILLQRFERLYVSLIGGLREDYPGTSQSLGIEKVILKLRVLNLASNAFAERAQPLEQYTVN